jgi:hypothetical protein
MEAMAEDGERMVKATQREIDHAYQRGKKAYFRRVGTNGPTFRRGSRAIVRTENPYPHDSELHLAWQRSYVQDARKPNALRFTLDKFEVEITLLCDECANETDDD